MSVKITKASGHSIPPAPRHSVTTQMPTWEDVERYGTDSSAVIPTLKHAYPRMKPHADIADLSAAVLKLIGAKDEGCFLFSSLQSAQECVEYSISQRRNDGANKSPLSRDQIKIRAFSAKDTFLAVVFQSAKRPVVNGFWYTPGVGVSSRFAEANLDAIEHLVEVPMPTSELPRSNFEGSVHDQIRERIVHHITRERPNRTAEPQLSINDVYFYTAGMASIYKSHSYLLKVRSGTTVLFGLAFVNVSLVFEEYGQAFKFFGPGTEEDLDQLEAFLEEEYGQGRSVQSIWAEFPANPLLVTPNIQRLREISHKYEVVLALDDTLGSWANVDILNMADLLMTSVTKSFNGYADVIAGSVVLNPAGRKYQELKGLFDANYVPELYVDDASAIERNSRDYLARSARLNQNAAALVKYFESCKANPDSAIIQVYYPSISPSGKNFRPHMRAATPDFNPGYGCLLSIELEDLATTKAFYDNLNVYTGPHLGAPWTMVFAYVVCQYKNKLDWAAKYGLRPTQLRITAGLEDTQELLDNMKLAVEAADRVKNGLV